MFLSQESPEAYPAFRQAHKHTDQTLPVMQSDTNAQGSGRYPIPQLHFIARYSRKSRFEGDRLASGIIPATPQYSPQKMTIAFGRPVPGVDPSTNSLLQYSSSGWVYKVLNRSLP